MKPRRVVEDSYFNTTRSSGRELKEFEVKAKNQDEKILEFFRTASEFLYTPSEIWRFVFIEDVPLTSVRRSMTNLTNQGKLVKSDKQRKGPYGRPEYCWHGLRPVLVQAELFDG